MFLREGLPMTSFTSQNAITVGSLQDAVSLIGPIGPTFLIALVQLKSCPYLTAVLVHLLHKFEDESGKLERDCCVFSIRSTIGRRLFVFHLRRPPVVPMFRHSETRPELSG